MSLSSASSSKRFTFSSWLIKERTSQSQRDASSDDSSVKRQRVTSSAPNDMPSLLSSPHSLSLGDVAPLTCRQPAFRNQQVISTPGRYFLSSNVNSVVLLSQALSSHDLAEYLRGACAVERFSGPSGYAAKPRKEVCYTTTGQPLRYSGINHPTVQYPAHVLAVTPKLLASLNTVIASNEWTKLSHGIDISYSAEFPRGGSISAHSDDEGAWGLVLIYSLGRNRWLRIRKGGTGEWWNVLMRHNSLLAMHGATFQAEYTHQIDKLHKDEAVGTRLSLNLRFEKGSIGE